MTDIEVEMRKVAVCVPRLCVYVTRALGIVKESSSGFFGRWLLKEREYILFVGDINWPFPIFRLNVGIST